MFCPRCGEKVFLTHKIYTVDDLICENCNHYITVKDHGPAPPAMMESARRRFQRQYENNVRGLEPIKNTLNRMGIQVMHNPNERTRPGYVVATSF